MTRRHRRKWPAWVIVMVGALLTGAGLIWASSLYDSHGRRFLDNGIEEVLIALIGVVGTVLTLLLERQRATKDEIAATFDLIQHETQPNSGSSLRDSNDRTERLAREALAAATRAEAAVGELREDHQALRADTTEIRRDIGRIADALSKENPS